MKKEITKKKTQTCATPWYMFQERGQYNQPLNSLSQGRCD